MRASPTFIDILEAKIRRDLQAEFDAELRVERGMQTAKTAYPDVELWLATRMAPRTVPPTFANRYKVLPPPAKRATPETKTQVTPEPLLALDDVACIAAREIFRRNGAELPALCTRQQVKSTFRRLASTVHPDRHAQADPGRIRAATEAFTALVQATSVLLEHYDG